MSHPTVSPRHPSSLAQHASSLALAVLLVAPAEGLAKSCKPDASAKDKITKQQTDEWPLFATSLATESWINVSMSIGRFGAENQLIVILEKRDSSPGPALFASKGTEVLLGFSEGEPATFRADQVTTDTQPDIYGGMRSVVYRAILRNIIKDHDLPALKISLTSKSLDAVRIVLPGGLTIESSVKRQNSEHFQEKLLCFFTYAREKGYLAPAQQLDSDHLHALLTLALSRHLLGDTSIGGRGWPMRVQLVSFDKSTGQVVGQVDWTTLNSINKFVGNVVGNKLVFRETEFIKKGKATLNCEYTLTASSPSTLDGVVACPQSGETHLALE